MVHSSFDLSVGEISVGPEPLLSQLSLPMLPLSECVFAGAAAVATVVAAALVAAIVIAAVAVANAAIVSKAV